MQKFKEIDIFRILGKIFDLSKKEYEFLNLIYLMNRDGVCVHHFVSKWNKERSLVQKRLQNLLKKGLVKRKSVSISEYNQLCQKNKDEQLIKENAKGYLFLYYPIPKAELLKRAESILKRWYSTLEEFLREEEETED
ncbi:MAG: hypothetical protein ACTSU2_16095 [Promethearchaeota archaeon]